MRYPLAAVLAIMLALPAVAQDYRKGWDAYQRGDHAAAVREWRALAEQGDAAAQNSLGVMYDNGQGVPRDGTEAVKWYRKAAEQRNLDAQNNLGVLYLAGRSVPRDQVRGLMWVSVAAAGGDEPSVKSRDDLVARLPPDLVAEAYRLAREWLKQHPKAMRKSALLCRRAIVEAEREHRLPAKLLSAVSIVESGRWSKARREIIAWPWTVQAEGRGRYLKSKAAAIAAVRRLRARGVRSIDVGCMQINLRYHPKAFANLSEALEPRRNVDYAARYLVDLKRETDSWNAAVGRYHSKTPALASRYRRKVQAVLRGEPPRPRFYRRRQTTSGGLYVRR